MMYLNQNNFNLNDMLVQGSSQIQYNQLLPNGTYQQQLQPQLHMQPQKALNQNSGLYTFSQATATPGTINPYDPNRIQNSQNSQQRNSRSTSASSLSSVSSTSSTSSIYSNSKSTDAQSISGNTQGGLTTQQNQSFNKTNPLSNNSLYPYNLTYFNPQLSCPFPTAPNGSQLSSTQVSQSGAVTSNNATTNSSATSALTKINPNIISYPNLNDKFVYQPSTKESSENLITTIDPNYQLGSTLEGTKNGNLNTSLQLNTSTSNLVNSDVNSSLLLYKNTKNSHHRQPFYNSNQHFKPNPLAFLPMQGTDIYYSTEQNQLISSQPTNTIHSGFNLAPSITDLGFNNKPMQIHTFNSKTQFTVGLNVKRKRRFKKPPELRNVLPKNSLMLLHEYRPNVEYRFVCQSGPIHRPMFTMCVDINEHKFEGTGKTKKDARMQAAEKALEFLIQNPEYIQKPTQEGKNKQEESVNEENDTEEPEENDDDETSPKRKKIEIETPICPNEIDNELVNDVKIPIEQTLNTVIEKEVPSPENDNIDISKEKLLIS